MGGQRRAFGGFLLDTAAGFTRSIRDIHRAISGRVFRYVGPVATPVRAIHDAVTGLAYGSVGGGFRLAAVGVRALPLDGDPKLADPAEQSDLALVAQSAANGFFGDRLNRMGDELAIPMGFVHDRRPLAIDTGSLLNAVGNPSSTVVVFVHGLAESERCWWSPPGHKDHRGLSYGDRLQRDLGATALYLRYNSGLHISDNGFRLSGLLDELVAAWPVPLEQLIVVGHSMGGLVIRSACLQAAAVTDRPWVGRVRHVVCLGSPHLGAPLERVVNRVSQSLGRLAEGKPVADILELRSDGVRDLRFGYLLQDEWMGADPKAVRREAKALAPNLEGASHWFVSGSLRPGRHPFNRVLGDLLVHEASAVAPSRRADGTRLEGADTAHFPGLDHLVLSNHPDVYAQLRTWLAPSSADRPTARR